jgi:transcriptional regulator with XRE-family HTH domain
MTNRRKEVPQMAKRDALKHFLTTKRALIDPESAGFKPNPRRHSKGLTREQVAEMAGVSSHWYARFESGSAVNVSPSVIASIARALKLTRNESVYLFRLAGQETPEGFPALPQPDFSLAQQVINDFTGGPAAICDSRLDVLAVNRVTELLAPADAAVHAPFNMLELLFVKPFSQSYFENWKLLAQDRVALFRAYYARHADDPDVQKFVTSMRKASPYFDKVWDAGHVKIPTPSIVGLQLAHPQFGTLRFEEAAFPFQEGSEFFITFATAADAHTKDTLRRLLHSPVSIHALGIRA